MASSKSNQNNDDIITDINVTPLVDIVLVLLIIFMVTASFIVAPAIKVDLPKAANADDKPDNTIALILTENGQLFVNGKETDWSGMKNHIRTQMVKLPDMQAVISADKNLPHGDVIHLIDTIKGLGIVRFALNIERIDYQSELQPQG